MILPDVQTDLNALVLGASRGIGLGFVQLLLADGRFKRIFATSRSEGSANQLSQLEQVHRGRLKPIKVDVTQEASLAAATSAIKAEVKELHLVIYCVGVLHDDQLFPEKSLRDLTASNLLRSFEVNSVGAALSAKHLSCLFSRRTPGIFACLSAKVGSIEDNRLGGWYGYRASKAALNMFVKTMAIEFGRSYPQTIVVALHPGTTDTDLSKPFQSNVAEGQLCTVSQTVQSLGNVLSNLTIKDSGSFFSWNGNTLPW